MRSKMFRGLVCTIIAVVLVTPAILCSPGSLGQPTRKRYISPNSLPADVSFVAEMQGEQLKAFLAAYKALQEIPDLAASKKHMENYSVKLVQNKDNYYVTFIPKSDPPPKSSGTRAGIDVGAENSMGCEVRFTVRKIDFKVVRQVVLI